MNLAERAARIGQTARSFEDAKGSTKPAPTAQPVADAPKTSGDPPRHWWDVHTPDRIINVFVVPAQTQRAMRDLYPDAAVCQP